MSNRNVPPADEAYLRANHRRESVPVMAKALHRGTKTVDRWMAELGLERKTDRDVGRNHPFRRQNRKLETLLLGHRIANSNRKKFS